MMFHLNDPDFKEKRRALRRNITPQEKLLWGKLRTGRCFGYKFRRQYSIGPYIVDFCCPLTKLVIEIDGSQHQTAVPYDTKRDTFLKANGYTVFRFWNNEINGFMDGVMMRILDYLDAYRPGSSRPSEPPLLT